MMTTATPTPSTNMYTELDSRVDHPSINGEEIFGFYRPKELREKSFLAAFRETIVHKGPGSYDVPAFTNVILKDELVGMRKAILNQDIRSISPRAIKAIMESPTAFSQISKREFATAFVDAIQHPRSAAIYALSSIFNLSRRDTPIGTGGLDGTAAPERIEATRMAVIQYGLNGDGRNGFLLSGQAFRTGDFESNPLTADEIRALPCIAGFYPEVYAEVEHNHAIHAKAVVTKLMDAGFTFAATNLARDNGVELGIANKEEKPARKYDQDSALDM